MEGRERVDGVEMGERESRWSGNGRDRERAVAGILLELGGLTSRPRAEITHAPRAGE